MKGCDNHKQTLTVRSSFDDWVSLISWSLGWPAAPTVMTAWQAPKPQHSTPRRGPDQEQRKVFIIWVALIFQRVLRSVLLRLRQVAPKGNTEIPSINSTAKFRPPTKLWTKNCEFYCHLSWRECRAGRDYRDAGSLLCVRLISIPVTLQWEG